MLDVQLADNRKAWELAPDGAWRKVRAEADEAERSSQAIFMENALRRRSR